MLGTKIKELRMRRQISQTTLAEALNVSPQTVSKWENHVSSPDISVLPQIAKYFEISMDDLFGYRVERLHYKERFVLFLYESNMLDFGSFVLKSGRKSPYIIDSGHNHLSSRLSQLGLFYGECIREHALTESVLFGASPRDVALVAATVMSIRQRYDIDMQYCAEIDVLKHIDTNREITLLTDTFTSGKTLQNEIKRIIGVFGKAPKNVIVGVDRMEQSEHAFFAARGELEARFGVRIFSIISFDDIIKTVEKEIIPAKQFLQDLYQYKKKYIGVPSP